MRIPALSVSLVLAMVGAQFLIAQSASADPFSVTSTGWTSRAFSPNGDSFEDSIQGVYCLTSSANVDVTVQHAGGSVVKTLEVGVSHLSGCLNSWDWDGKDTGGAIVSSGNYDVVVLATDQFAATSTVIFHTAVDNAAVATVTTPANNATVNGLVNWLVTPAAGRSLAQVNGPNDATTPVEQPSHTWTGSFDSTTLVNGTQSLTWNATYDDALGGTHNAPLLRQVVVNNPETVTPEGSWASRTFSPNGDGYEDTLDAGYCVSADATVTVIVRHTAGATVATLDAGTAVLGHAGFCGGQNGESGSFSWDGTDGHGVAQPQGAYEIVVTAQPTSGAAGSRIFSTRIDSAPVAIVTSPANGATVSGTLNWVVTAASGRTLSAVSGPTDVDPPVEQPDHTWTGNFDTTGLLNGSQTLTWHATYDDVFGATHSYAPVPRTVVVSNGTTVRPAYTFAPRSFSPNGDGFEDTLTSAFCLSDDANVSVIVRHTGGATVATLDPGTDDLAYGSTCGQFGSSGSWTWDGTDGFGAAVPDGSYDIVVTAQPATGAAGSYVFATDVETAPVATVTTPANNASVSGTLDWVVTPAAGHTLLQVNGPTDIGPPTEQPDHTWTGQFDTTTVANGPQTLTWHANYNDSFGASHFGSPVPRNVTVNNSETVTPSIRWNDSSFSPNADGQEDTIGASYCLSNDANVSVIVRHTGGATVKTLDPGTDDPAFVGICGYTSQSGSWEWDGTNTALTTVPDGPYEVVVTATPTVGTPASFVFKTVVDTAAVGTVTSPAANATVAGLVRFALVPSPGRAVTQVDFSFDNGSPRATGFNASADGVWRTTISAGQLIAGPANLYVYVTYNDSFNQPHTILVSPLTHVTIDNTSIPLAISAVPTSGSAPLTTSLTIATSDANNRALSIAVDWGDGSPVTSRTSNNPYADVVVPHTYTAVGTFTPQVTVSDGVAVPAVKSLTIIVQPRATTTGVSCTPNPSVFGQSLSCSATVAPVTGTGTPTGTIQFTVDGGGGFSPVSLNASGTASVTLSGLAVTTHPVVATYSGDATFTASSGTITQSVGRASTSTGVSSSASPAPAGQLVTFTAAVTVTSPGAGSPTGTVQFAIDGSNVGSLVPVDGTGHATYATSTLAVGTHTVTATYGGDGSFTGSASSPFTQSISAVAIPTTTGVSCSPNPSVFGQPVSCTITTSSGAGTPTGTVSVTVDGVASGPPLTLVAGAATFNGSGLATGGHGIVASYSPSVATNFVASVGSVTQTVNKAGTSFSVVCVVNPSVTGQSVTCTATVLPVAPGVGTPTGTVQFSIDGVATGSPTALGAGGQATLTRSNLSVGSHPIAAAYSGDGSFVASTGSTSQAVNKAATSTAVVCTPSPATYGQSLSCTATLAVTAPGAGTPSGSILFSVDGTTVTTVGLSGGAATATVPNPSAGTHTITAVYGGDASFSTSTGSVVDVVNKAATTAALSCTPNPIQVGATLTCVATLTVVAPGAGLPTGSVQFSVDGTSSGLPIPVSGNQASFTIASLGVGSHSLTAAYGGDTNFSGSSASAVSVDVTSTPIVSTTLALACTPNPAVSNQPVTCTATVSAASGTPTGTVQFTLDGGGPVTAPIVSGSASFGTQVPVGSHPVTASFTPTANSGFSGSSASTSLVVNLALTATTLTCVPNASVFGQPVACTASVHRTSPGTGQPTGTVQLAVDGVNVGSPIALDGSQQAAFNPLTLAVGNRSLTATYGGETQLAGSVGTASQVVSKAATTTSTVCSPNPADTTQPVSCTATVVPVAPGAGSPSGSVQFSVDGVPVGLPVSLNGSGTATIPLGTQTAGTHPVLASYSGDGSFAASTQTISLTVGAVSIPTTTTIDCSPQPSTVGQTVTCTATVTRTAGGSAPTGSVQFSVDGSLGVPVVLSAIGTAPSSIATLAPGSHPVSVTYLPASGTTFGQSNASTIQNVTKASTSTTLACAPTPSVFGQSVTCTATVATTSTTAGSPTGSVQFSIDGTAVVPAATINASGIASIMSSTLAVGTHAVTASYGGDASFTTSAAATFNQAVNQAATSAALSCSPNPSSVGQTVTCTATVSATGPGAGTPTGPVIFSVDGVAGSAMPLDASRQAQLITTTLAAGNHTIVAVYGGDARFGGSTSPPVSQGVSAVVLRPTSTTVTCTPDPSVFGQPVTCTASVASGAGQPTGTVQFSVDNVAFGGPQTLVSARASLPISPLAVGNHPVAATYTASAGSTWATSSGSTTQTVNRARTATAITCTPNPSVIGANVTCVATVTASAPGAGTPTGTVQFSIDGVNVTPARTLNASGAASFSSITLAVGARTIRAAYSGDARFFGSGGVVTQTVRALATSTTLSCTPAASVPGRTVTCSATVTGPVGAGTPSGAVSFLNNGAALGGQVALSATGVARLTTSALASGSHTIVANYLGTARFQPSTASALVRVDYPPHANNDGVWNIGAGQTLCVGRARSAWPASASCDSYIVPSVLANDTDPDGAGPTIARLNGIDFAAGEYSGLATNGSFSYTAGINTARQLTKVITYHAEDSAGVASNAATITIVVHPRPTGNTFAYSMRPGQTLCVGTTAVRPPGGRCTASVASLLSGATGTGPLHIHVSQISFASGEYSGVLPDGSFAYKAGAGIRVRQVKVITFQVVDALGVSSVDHTISITINP